MIDPEHKLSVVRQAKLLGFSRGSVYYLPRPVPDGDLGSGLVDQSQKITVAARAMAERKAIGHLS